MSGDPRPAPAAHLRLVLSLDDSLAEALALLGVRAALTAQDLLPGRLRLTGSAGEHAAQADAGLPDLDAGLPDLGAGLAGVELLVADPWDVPVLVERGAVDAGVAPKHVLAELRPDLFEVLDLRLAQQRLAHVAVAGVTSLPAGRRPRLATAHPHLTRAHFARAGVQVETLALRSAAQLAAALGAADGAVVLLPPDERQTAGIGVRIAGVSAMAAEAEAKMAGFVVQTEVLRSSARLVVNRSARVVRGVEVSALVDALRIAVQSRAAARSEARADAVGSPPDPPTIEQRSGPPTAQEA